MSKTLSIYCLIYFGFLTTLLANYKVDTLNYNTPKSNWISLELSSELDSYLTLDELSFTEERREQIRDWILYAILSKENISEEELKNSIYDLSPFRQGYLQNVYSYQYGLSRSVTLSNDELLLLLPNDSLKHLELIANEVDKYRMETGRKINKIKIYEYNTNNLRNTHNIQFRFVSTKDGDNFFDLQTGYQEVTVRNNDDLIIFLNQVEDLTYFKKDKKGIILGGRTYQNQPRTNLSVAEVATIFQSYNQRGRMGFSLEPEKNDIEFAQHLLESTKDSESFYEKLLQEGFSIKEIILLREVLLEKAYPIQESALNILEGERNTYRKFKNQLWGIFEPFELDTLNGLYVDYITQDIWEVLVEKSNKSCLDISQLTQEVLNYKKENLFLENKTVDGKVWKSIINESTTRSQKLALLKKFLHLAEMIDSKICPEYYGITQGTEVGMTLFYTDALMKLWAIDYKETTPFRETGMLSKQNLSLHTSYLYDDISYEFPTTRFWLSPSDRGFNFFDKDEIIFSNIATQLNAKAKPDSYSDAGERDALPSTVQFISWWNNHYDIVADYEQQFHKLDQIIKWSLICLWLQEKENTTFNFLNTVKFDKSLNFQDWYKNNSSLTVRTPLPFVADTTECLKLYEGNDVYGGVSPGTKRHLNKSPIRAKSSVTKVKEIYTSEGYQPEVIFTKNESGITTSRPSKKPMQGLKQEVVDNVIEQTIQKDNSNLLVIQKIGNKPIHEIQFTSKKGVVQVNITKRIFRKLEEFAKIAIKGNQKEIAKNISAIPEAQKIVLFPYRNRNMVEIEGQWIYTSEYTPYTNYNAIAKGNYKTKRAFSFKDNINEVETQLNAYDFWTIQETNNKAITLVDKKAPSLYGSEMWKNDRIELTIEGNEQPLELVNGLNELHLERITKNETALSALDKIQAVKMEAVKYWTKIGNKAEAAYYYNQQLISFKKKGNKNTLIQKLAENILTPTSELNLYTVPKKKGVTLERNNNLVISNKPSKKDISIAKAAIEQIEKDPSLAKIYEQMDFIKEQDLQILSRIPKEQNDMRVAYLEMRELTPKDIPDDVTVVSIQANGKNPVFIYITNKVTGVQIKELSFNLSIDFKNAGQRISKAKTKREAQKKLTREMDLLNNIIETTGSKNIVTMEYDGLSAAKIWALNDGNKSVKFKIDDPQLKRSIDNFQENIIPDFNKMIILTSSPRKDTIFSYLYRFKTDTIVGASWLMVQKSFKNPEKTQIVLEIDTYDEDKIIF